MQWLLHATVIVRIKNGICRVAVFGEVNRNFIIGITATRTCKNHKFFATVRYRYLYLFIYV